ncbi:hypothetical protein PT974_07802 [Cladobotryum mycophilum]|uniref:Glycosyltransferase family 31 protein n=1 Tax=Cladobotryum mycophilum TaxID=491253 RepID=A0ABR0SHY6_9HYPO
MLKLPQYPSPPRRKGVILAFCITILLLYTFAAFDDTESRAKYVLRLAQQSDRYLGYDEPCEVDYLRRKEYNLTRSIVYQKRCFRGVQDSTVDRKVVSDVGASLLGSGSVIHLGKGCQEDLFEDQPCQPISLDVPPPFPKADLSDTIFGVATTYERLQDSIPQFSHWLANSGGQLLAVIIDHGITNRKLESLTNQYKSHDMNLVAVRPWNSTFDVKEQHFTIVRDLVQHATPNTQWVAIIDDDTFFPSPYSIAKLLDEHDSDAPVYIGGLSEDKAAVDFHGFMAFGGAGIFMSMPLVKQLEPKIEECLEEITVREGDGLLGNCIYNKTDTELTAMSGLHQFDMAGDLGGFYESGRFPLSLHHWKSWHQAPVDRMAKVVDFCGGCFLQRWRFGPDTVFTNGYSIAVFEDGISHDELKRTEGTWDRADAFEATLGPLRDKTEDGRKKSYVLVGSERVGENLRQIYVCKATGDGGEMMDEVVEVWWER